MYLPCFPPDRPVQLVTSPSDDDMKEILYRAMPNMWKKKMINRDTTTPIHSMAEFFEKMIENLEKVIPPSVTSKIRRNPRKSPRKRNQ